MAIAAFSGGPGVDEKVKTSTNDTTPDFLQKKIEPTDDSAVHEWILRNAGGNETFEYVRYFGMSPTFSKSDSQSSTTSTSFQNKLNMVSGTTVSSAVYLLMWNASIRASDVGAAVEVRVQSDDTTTHAQQRYWSGDAGGTNWASDFNQFSGVDWFNGDGTTISFDMDFRRSDGTGSVFIEDARIIIWRLTKP